MNSNFIIAAVEKAKDTTVWDWISNNFVDCTPHKCGVTLEVSYGFIGIIAVLMFFWIAFKIQRRRPAP